MPHTHTLKTVPAAALRCAAGHVVFLADEQPEEKPDDKKPEEAADEQPEEKPEDEEPENEEPEEEETPNGLQTIPVSITARTGQPIQHWYWGKLIHDLAGMQLHKNAVAIDYCHNESEVIGFLNEFSTDSGALLARGALTPFRADDRAAEVAAKGAAGVPWESSINFGGDGLALEILEEGASAEVNGATVEGPATIVRQWPLRGVAICPYGADANTPVELAADAPTVQVRVLSAAKAEGSGFRVQGSETEAAAPPNPEIPKSPPPKTGPDFLAAFGDRGGVLFAEGKGFDEAAKIVLAEQRTEIAALRAAVQKLRGEPAPLSAHPGDQARADDGRAAAAKDLSARIGEPLARAASALKFRRR